MPESRRLRAAVIGCGRIGSTFDDERSAPGFSHAGAYSVSELVELVGVCDSNADTAASAARRWGLEKSFTDIEQLARDTHPDIVSVCTPDDTHVSVARQALALGIRGLLLEKPIAPTLQEAQALVRELKSQGALSVVNYSRRFAPGLHVVRDALASGRFGAIQHVTGLYTKGIVHNGTHWIDLVRFLVGEPKRVRSLATADKDDRDPTVPVWFEFESGCTGILSACNARHFAVFELDIIGTAGRFSMRDGGHRLELHRVADDPVYPGFRMLVPDETLHGGLSDALPNAVRNLARAIAGLESPLCTADDALTALSIASAVVASAQGGGVERSAQASTCAC